MNRIIALVFIVLIGLSSSAAFGFEPDTSDKMQLAVTAGASADANYGKGVAVFTNVGGGLMYEASISGQKFTYEPVDDQASPGPLH